MRAALACAIVVLGLVALAPTARASSHCHEVSSLLGRQQCRRFGSGWTPPSVRWELGAALLRFDLPPVDTMPMVKDQTYHLTSSGGRVSAFGPRWRTEFGFRGVYIGDEITVGFVTSAPPLAVDTIARGATAPGVDATGVVATGMFLVGDQVAVGRALFGAELAVGMRGASLAPPGSPTWATPVDFALETRVRAGIWLTRWLSASAIVGASLVHRDDYSIGVSLGLHLFPYDGTR